MSNTPFLIKSQPPFDSDVINSILFEFDGWVFEETPSENQQEEDTINPFFTIKDMENGEASKNKKLHRDDLEYHYNSSFKEALTHTNRHNINDLGSIHKELFMNGVIKLTAANLSNKYNIGTTKTGEEGEIQVFNGSKLYNKALKILDKFVLSQLVGLSG